MEETEAPDEEPLSDSADFMRSPEGHQIHLTNRRSCPRWTERRAFLVFGPNAQDRYGSFGYRRADPCAESIRYTPGVVFDS